MNQEQVLQLANLQLALEQRVEEIRDILGGCKKYEAANYVKGDACTLYVYKNQNNTLDINVTGSGYGNCCMGECEHFELWFPAEYLWMSKEELVSTIEKIKEEEKQSELLLEKKRKECIEANERAQCEKLKAKYG